MDVVFSIQGRKALPVWVLPSVTSWELSPDALVTGLVNPRNNPSNTFPAAFKLNTKNEPVPLLCEQWKTTKIQINSLDEQLRNDGKPIIQSLAKWRTDSIQILQKYRAFVWLDEFQKWFDKQHFAHKRFDFVDDNQIVEKPGLELCLSPLLDEDFVRCLEVEKVETESHEGQSKNLSNIDKNELDRSRTKAKVIENKGRPTNDSQLHALIWRVRQFVYKDGEGSAQKVWIEIRHRHEQHDTEEIIQEVTAAEILWRSAGGSEQKFRRRSLDSLLSRLKNSPPF